MEAFVLTVDGRRSRSRGSDAEGFARALTDRGGDALPRPFAVTAGDELQGLTTDPAAIIDLVLMTIADGRWWIGIGVGDVEEPLPRTVNAARGDAFYRARAAVEAAKTSPDGLAVRGDDDLDAACAALAFVVGRRSPAQAQTVALAEEGLRQAAVAERLGITQQAVSKRLVTAGWDVERRLRRLATTLAARRGG